MTCLDKLDMVLLLECVQCMKTWATEASGEADLLSLKSCMSHQVHKGQCSKMGKYIMQQASRSAGRRCWAQWET